VSLPKIRLERCVNEGCGCWRLDPEQERHLVRSLRSYDGASVEGLLSGDCGARLLMRLESDGKGRLLREVAHSPEVPDSLSITLLIALLKTEQFNAVLHASAELGVQSIIPVVCERSVPRIDESGAIKKISRWRKILDESTLVSGAAFSPQICAPIDFGDIPWNGLPQARYAAVIAPDALPVARILPDLEGFGELAFAVGPEGDWTEREKTELFQNGFVSISLGRRVMRASTAAIVACGCFRLSSL
ncbi:MAG: 16S rRNA (uracil(1498)-N(3))-methyltransferase, partial [Synergistaceae bacterium]|jgi:16S rRNA (uracil1498-N3)-methyltransferase|nr:16S rRNA (uracil(1498)-N(3))-methyltransferase [Synergistaceae bacterium]